MKNPWIDIGNPVKDFVARRILQHHPLDLFWAISTKGSYTFLFAFSGGFEPSKLILPDLEGIQAFFTRRADGDISGVGLGLVNLKDWELFYSICSDLIQVTQCVESCAEGYRAFVVRLEQWQKFFKKTTSGMLSEERIKGLIGELLFIKEYLFDRAGPRAAIDFWTGPNGFPQDFCVNNVAVEVKTQISTSSPKIRISSVNQLWTSAEALYLYLVTLGKGRYGDSFSVNLFDLVNEIQTVLHEESEELLDRFNGMLRDCGFYPNEKYLNYNYVVISKRWFEIEDGFPRLDPRSCEAGVLDIQYSISIDACEAFEVQEGDVCLI